MNSSSVWTNVKELCNTGFIKDNSLNGRYSYLSYFNNKGVPISKLDTSYIKYNTLVGFEIQVGDIVVIKQHVDRLHRQWGLGSRGLMAQVLAMNADYTRIQIQRCDNGVEDVHPEKLGFCSRENPTDEIQLYTHNIWKSKAQDDEDDSAEMQRHASKRGILDIPKNAFLVNIGRNATGLTIESYHNREDRVRQKHHPSKRSKCRRWNYNRESIDSYYIDCFFPGELVCLLHNGYYHNLGNGVVIHVDESGEHTLWSNDKTLNSGVFIVMKSP